MTDPVPSRPNPVLHVPVRPGGAGPVIRVFRTAVGFSTVEQLEEVLGTGAPRIVLAECVLRSLVGPLGIAQLTVDPTMVAAPPDRPVLPEQRSSTPEATAATISAVVPA